MAGIPDSDAHDGVLSRTTHPDWPSAFRELCRLGVPLTKAHEAEIMNHADTQFALDEFVNLGYSACAVRVHYDVRTVP